MNVIHFPIKAKDTYQTAALGNTMSDKMSFQVVVADDGTESIVVEHDEHPFCGIHPHADRWHIVAPDWSTWSTHSSADEAVRNIAS